MIRIHLSKMLGQRKERVADVQRATGLARNTLAGLYREDATRIDLATLEAVCRHLGCQVGDLLELVDDVEAQPHAAE